MKQTTIRIEDNTNVQKTIEDIVKVSDKRLCRLIFFEKNENCMLISDICEFHVEGAFTKKMKFKAHIRDAVKHGLKNCVYIEVMEIE